MENLILLYERKSYFYAKTKILGKTMVLHGIDAGVIKTAAQKQAEFEVQQKSGFPELNRKQLEKENKMDLMLWNVTYNNHWPYRVLCGRSLLVQRIPFFKRTNEKSPKIM